MTADFKLGKRPENTEKPKVAFAGLVSTIPDHPLVDRGPTLHYDMDKNDIAGVCVVAGANHALQVICSLLGAAYTPWTEDQVLAYYQTQNPDFRSWADAGGPADRGMVIADFLSYLVKKGVILGFAKVDHTNPEEVRAAAYLGLALVSGANLQTAQQNPRNVGGVRIWEYVAGSGEWGGHCTSQDGYDSNGAWTITWGSDAYRMADSFMQHCVDEVYFVITQAHVDNPGFRDHLGLEEFGKRFTQLTGRPWSYSPGPAPAPTPPSGGGACFQVSDAVAARVRKAAARAGMTPDAYADHRLAVYFKITS